MPIGQGARSDRGVAAATRKGPGNVAAEPSSGRLSSQVISDMFSSAGRLVTMIDPSDLNDAVALPIAETFVHAFARAPDHVCQFPLAETDRWHLCLRGNGLHVQKRSIVLASLAGRSEATSAKAGRCAAVAGTKNSTSLGQAEGFRSKNARGPAGPTSPPNRVSGRSHPPIALCRPGPSARRTPPRAE